MNPDPSVEKNTYITSVWEILKLWWTGIVLVKSDWPKVIPIVALAPLTATLLSVPPQLFASAFRIVPGGGGPSPQASDALNDFEFSFSLPVPIELTTFIGKYEFTVELWAYIVLLLVVSTLLIQAFLIANDYLAMWLKNKIAVGIQTRIFSRFLRDAATGVNHDTGEIKIALQSYSGIISGLVTRKLKDSLEMVFYFLQAGLILFTIDPLTAGVVALWGAFFCFVAPSLPIFSRKKGGEDKGASSPTPRPMAASASGLDPSAKIELSKPPTGESGPPPSSPPPGDESGRPPAPKDTPPTAQTVGKDAPVSKAKVSPAPSTTEQGGAKGLVSKGGELAKEQYELSVEMQNILQECSNNLRTIVSLGIESTQKEKLRRFIMRNQKVQLKAQLFTQFNTFVLNFSSMSTVIALIGGLLAKKAGNELFNLLKFAEVFIGKMQEAASLYAMEVQGSVGLQKAVAALQSLDKEGEETPMIDSPADIRFKDVRLMVHTDSGPKEILKGMSFHIPAGSVVGIIGPAGCGKSTIHKVLAGVEPLSGGEVTINDRNFSPEKRVDTLRSTTIIAQFSQLFKGSVKENIMIGDQRSNISMVEALEKALIPYDESFLNRKVDPYSVKGIDLSGGEQKRVTLARALVRPLGSILLIDEVDSGLNGEKRRAIFRNIIDWCRSQATTLIVTHNPDDLPSDFNLFIEAGQCVDFGPHQELLEKNPAYRACCGLEEKD